MSSGSEVHLCFRCSTAVAGAPCPACGGEVEPATLSNINRLVGQRTVLGAPPHSSQKPPAALPAPAENARDEAFARAAHLREERRKEREARRRETDERERQRRTAKRAAKDREHEEIEHGVRALAAADHEPIEKGIRVAIYENLGWFLGAFLVLAGSIYGVREAWLRLDAAGRYLVIGSAFFVYHTAFIIFGSLLAKRSPRTGRIMSFVALGLLPVTTTTWANLARAEPTTGLAATAVFAVLAFFTSSIAIRRFVADVPRAISLLVLAPMLAEVLLPQLGDTSIARFLVPLAGLVACAIANRVLPLVRPASGVFAVIVYAALALGVFALTSDASDTSAADFTRWRTGTAWFSAWIAAWTAMLGIAISDARTRALVHGPALAAGLELGGVALSMIATFAASWIALGDATDPRTAFIAASTALVSAAHTMHLARQRPALVHVYLPFFAASASLFIQAVSPGFLWPLGFIAVAIVAQQLGLAAGWVIGLGGFGLIFIAVLEPWPVGQLPIGASLGFVSLALSSHVAGFRGARRWHYFAALLASIACVLAAPAWLTPERAPLQLLALAAIYGVIALVDRPGDEAPFDDASLAAALGALAWSLSTVAPAQSFAIPPWASLSFYAAPLAASALLVLRAFRDKSRVVSLAGLTGVAIVVLLASGAGSFAQAGLVIAGLGLVLMAIAALLEDGTADDTLGRSMFGLLELPLGDRGRKLAARACATAAIAAVPIAWMLEVSWLGRAIEVDRTAAIDTGVAVLAILLIGFLSRAWIPFRLRGSNATLWAIAVVIAVTAVVNRIGRPLTPDIVGRNLTIIAVAVWFVALAMRRFGPKLGAWLGMERSGARYQVVPHTGVAALGALLFVDALLVGAPGVLRAACVTPPLMLGGAGIALLLLGRSFARPSLSTGGWIVLAGAAALTVSQSAVLGPQLVPWAPPGGRWMPAALGASEDGRSWLNPALYLGAGAMHEQFQRALRGASYAVAACGVLALITARSASVGAGVAWATLGTTEAADRERAARAASWGAIIVGAAVAWIAFSVSEAWSAFFVLAGALAIGAARISRMMVLAAVVAGALVLHAVAQSGAIVPGWTGPAIALIGAAAALRTVFAGFSSQRSAKIAIHQVVAFTFLVFGAFYALAAGSTNAELSEGATVLINAGDRNLPFALVLGIGAVSSFASAFAWNATAARLPAVGLAALGVLCAASSFSIVALVLEGQNVPWSELALITASTAAVAHAARTALYRDTFADFASGLSLGRDLTLGITALLIYFSARTPLSPGLGLAALALAIVVSVHAAFSTRSGLHIYFVESGVLGAYGYIRAAWVQSFLPEHDALVILALGFLLIGVIVFARRTDLPPLSAATRRFAGALPIVVVIVLPWETSIPSAMFTAATGLFYAALGWVEKSRLFGALGAIVGNSAILVLALSQGLVGFDIYVVPLGVCLVVLTHVFGDDLDRRTRIVLRFVAAGLVYAPAAIALVLQVGNAEREIYPLIFGLGCMLGIALGMALHIRAYLALGTAGLVLDVVAHLIRASLQNQMLGFFLLSAAGLSILALMVLYTLRKAAAHALIRRWRERLRGWDRSRRIENAKAFAGQPRMSALKDR